MKPIGRGRRGSGQYTGLRIGEQFANAVLHFLRDHKFAKKHPDGGVILPIDEKTWQEVFKAEYPRIKPCAGGWTQSLEDYCTKYYNGGTKGLGYDLDWTVDFGTGRRTGRQHKGKGVSGTDKAVYPGSNSYLKPLQVIALVKKRSHEIPRKHDHGIARILDREWGSVERQGHFDPTDDREARRRILAAIVQRYGREQFRAELLEAYGGRCAVTGCNAQWALEAAHIKPYNGPKTDYVSNGLLLRGDIHTLFDLNLLGIEPDSWKIDLAPCLLGSSYEKYNGRVLRKPRCESKRPDKQAVTQRWKEFQKAVGDSHG
ncbi:MAG: HNH endonuclease [Pirellulaceae bacterium]